MNKKGNEEVYFKNCRGQVWIETVIYTLIAFVMIGLILSYAKPKIEELQDRAILEQSTNMLKEMDSIILTMGAAGNQRIVELGVKKGVLKLDCLHDKIIFEMESRNLYSEPGKQITDGTIIILTEKQSKYNLVTLTRDYSSNYNLKFDGNDEIKTLSKATMPYKLSMLNEGKGTGDRNVMNLFLS